MNKKSIMLAVVLPALTVSCQSSPKSPVSAPATRLIKPVSKADRSEPTREARQVSVAAGHTKAVARKVAARRVERKSRARALNGRKVAVGNASVKTPLDTLARNLVYQDEHLILSYQIYDHAFAMVRINPALWNLWSPGEQKQIGDILAAQRAWDEMHLVNARLYVYATEVGMIQPRWPEGKEFVLN